MAKPQLEQGYTRVANEIYDALSRIKLNTQEGRFVNFTIRMTYGWRATWAAWENKAWVSGTGMNRQQVNDTKARLIKRKIIIHNPQGIRLNKNWQEWCTVNGVQEICSLNGLQVYPVQGTSVPQIGYKKTRKPKKNKDSKGGKESKERKKYKAHSKEFALSEYLYEKVTKMFTDKGLDNPTEWNHATEAAYMDRLMRLKKQSPEQIREVIDGIVKDEFWQTIHFSPRKFYEKWDTLVLKFGSRMIEVPVYDNHGKQVGWKKQKPIS